ncbi:MAG: ssl1498 family light-harvesting-like protein [Tolypothrix sp. T3-bin4]|nr:ssl1498 family light-harvesting-like protein [Tolypothrix sp. T3-bin4]
MRYTTDDRGLLNNYAAEPAMYFAEYPSPEQQQRYALQAAAAILFVALTLFTALAVS